MRDFEFHDWRSDTSSGIQTRNVIPGMAAVERHLADECR
jgi:hypothetical protein